MKSRVRFAILCAIAVSLMSLYNLLVPDLTQEKNYNRIEQNYSLHVEDRLQRTETTKSEEGTKTSENERGIQLSNKLPENTSKLRINEWAATKHPQTFSPRKNLIIISAARGGSSFLGAIFDSNPQNMYWFEPLYVLEEKLFKANFSTKRKELNGYRESCLNVIDSFLKCDFSNLNNDILSAFTQDFFRARSQVFTALCPNKRCPPFSNILHSKTCNSYKHTVLKILNARLPNRTIHGLQELFRQQNRYDVKLIYLVRDPRAVTYSRITSVKWIKTSYLNPDFRFYVHEICYPIEQNIRIGLINPPSWLKNRFKVIRYEDLAVDTANIARELYRFAEFDWSISVDKWISAHDRPPSSAREKGAFSLFRDASDVINKWKNAPKGLIRVVEEICGDLMDMLGYEKLINHGPRAYHHDQQQRKFSGDSRIEETGMLVGK